MSEDRHCLTSPAGSPSKQTRLLVAVCVGLVVLAGGIGVLVGTNLIGGEVPPQASHVDDDGAITGNDEGTSAYTYNVAIPVRDQWDANRGYCGETSTIAAGQMYGQWLSQYDARLIYCSVSSSSKSDSACNTDQQYLVGVDDVATASLLHMETEEFDSEGSDGVEDYLGWVKKLVRRGIPVTICVYAKGSHDEEYDHIVTVTKIESDHDDDLYHDSDVITFDDHYSDLVRVDSFIGGRHYHYVRFLFAIAN